MVRDMERSIEWYQRVMGMTVWMDTEFVLSDGGLAAGNPGDKTRLVILKCEHDTIGMIGLLQWLEPEMPAPTEIPTSITFGNPTFVVASDDAQGTYDTAKALGTHIHKAPGEWSTTGQDGRTKHFIGMSLFDPDGYFFEVNQLLRIGD